MSHFLQARGEKDGTKRSLSKTKRGKVGNICPEDSAHFPHKIMNMKQKSKKTPIPTFEEICVMITR